MIPVPRKPGDIPPGPEVPRPIVRTGESSSLLLHALEEIDVLKRAVEALKKSLDALESRVASLESPRT